MTKRIVVEKKKARRPSVARELPPEDLMARERSLRHEIERQRVVRALQARGEAVDADISYDKLRGLLTELEWDALAIEGGRCVKDARVRGGVRTARRLRHSPPPVRRMRM
jgi:hypothetical protein